MSARPVFPRPAPDGRLYDHRPERAAWPNTRTCQRCGYGLIQHAGVLRRFAWRRGWL